MLGKLTLKVPKSEPIRAGEVRSPSTLQLPSFTLSMGHGRLVGWRVPTALGPSKLVVEAEVHVRKPSQTSFKVSTPI